MPHDAPLITTLVVALGLAFILGTIANRLKVSPIVGYLLAGVLVGPATPGFVADVALASQLAEIGVILLMFGVGLHFSVGDLLAVRRIAIPGAIGQIAIATLMGMGLAVLLGWPVPAGFVFGLALSVASTVVLLRALQEKRLVETEEGRIAVGWLVVEDLAMVLTLVLLPALAGVDGRAAADLAGILGAIGLTLGKVIAFVVLMFVVGRRVIPWLLHFVVHTGSRELFRLAVLAIALGVAFGAAELFDVSLALGAFFAGMILNESPLSQRAAEESLPFRDAFAVLFFVSVGMLLEPEVLISDLPAVIATAAIIIVGKSVAAFLIVRAFGYGNRVAVTISASLAQVGEFSFILASLGITLGLLPEVGQDLILAGAIISIIVNPILFDLLSRWQARVAAEAKGDGEARPVIVPTKLTGHAVIVGYGRVGRAAGEELRNAGMGIVVVEENPEAAEALKGEGIEVIPGNAVLDDIIAAANITQARWLLVAIPEAFEASQIVRHARQANADLTIIARAHFDAQVEDLKAAGASVVIMGEREIARGMVEYVLEGKKS